MHCRACQTPLAPETRFCPNCGERVSPQVSPAPTDPLRAGLEAALGDQYRIQRLLGRGGMGAVYLARETALDRPVAIKVLPPEQGDTRALQDRFRREARTAAKLTHPSIIPLHTFGEAEGVMYFVMGYVRGESLASRLRREGKLPSDEVRRILAEVADALDYAHRHGVVHRDIKPDNILLDDDSGRPMLADFGIAKARGASGDLTREGSLIGTPSFMSPEQASGKGEIDGRSDIYSLGVMGYAMVTGQLPFEGDTPRDVIMGHLAEEPAPLAEVAPEAPADIVTAVMRCLAKAPEERWPDGRSLRDALEQPVFERGELPEALEQIASWGLWLPTFLLVAVFAEWIKFLWQAELGPIAVMVLRLLQVPLVAFPFLFLVQAKQARDEGVPWRRLLWAAFLQPRWWRFWYPERLRRPGDVWHRLPAAVRRSRAASGALFILSVPVVAAVLSFFSPRLFEIAGVAESITSVMVPAIAVVVVLHIWAHRRLKMTGLTSQEADHVLNKSTVSRSFWRKPQIAVVLLSEPYGGRRPTPEPQHAQDYLQGIVHVAQELTGESREAGSRAISAARELLSKIELLDSEIRELKRSADSEEIDRLDRRLEALGPETEGESEQGRAMRQLVSKQRELALEVAGRLERRSAQSEQLLALLRDLWTELQSLSSSTPAPPERSERVRSLCADIERQAEMVVGPEDSTLA